MENPDQLTPPQDQQSELKLLIVKGKEQGFLTYAEVNDILPDDIVDPEQIEDIISMINDMGIEVPRRRRRRRRKTPPKKPSPHSVRWMATSAAPPTRCACTCARWARSNC
jgi:hypothetical protein